jgi:hypothetical protein
VWQYQNLFDRTKHCTILATSYVVNGAGDGEVKAAPAASAAAGCGYGIWDSNGRGIWGFGAKMSLKLQPLLLLSDVQASAGRY